jgi:hypothetical protein
MLDDASAHERESVARVGIRARRVEATTIVIDAYFEE